LTEELDALNTEDCRGASGLTTQRSADKAVSRALELHEDFAIELINNHSRRWGASPADQNFILTRFMSITLNL